MNGYYDDRGSLGDGEEPVGGESRGRRKGSWFTYFFTHRLKIWACDLTSVCIIIIIIIIIVIIKLVCLLCSCYIIIIVLA